MLLNFEEGKIRAKIKKKALKTAVSRAKLKKNFVCLCQSSVLIVFISLLMNNSS